MKPFHPSQMDRRLMSIIGLNPFPDMDSSPRMQMLGSHLGQMPVTSGRTERYLSTGMEQEFGKYTFNVKMPVNANILKVIDRYTPSNDINGIVENPETLIIYENEDTHEVDCLVLPRYCSYHSYFGFPYVPQPGLSKVRAGNSIKAGTVLLDSPGITPNGNYCYGTELNVAFMSHPAVAEDGIVVSRDVLPRFRVNTYETRDVGWGKKDFPLNLYGNDEVYKPFPDIGDLIREDGLLMAFRPHEGNRDSRDPPGLAAVKQNIKATQRVCHFFDNRVYVDGAGGRVVDIRVTTNDEVNPLNNIPDHQVAKYVNQTNHYYEQILEFYRHLQKQRKERDRPLVLGRPFHSLIVKALVATDHTPGGEFRNGKPNKQYISKLHRRAPLDNYRLEFVIEYAIYPQEGFKFTGAHGNKGVICHIAEPHEMPVDEEGNRADILMSPESNINRMLMGSPLELYLNAASRDVGKRVRAMVGIEHKDPATGVKLYKLYNSDPEKVKKAWDYLVSYYKVVAPKMYEWYSQREIEEEEYLAHLEEVIKDHVYLYIPPEHSPEPIPMVKEIEEKFRPVYGPVTYTGHSGRQVKTRFPVRIGSMYILMLEKIGNEKSAVDSARIQHFGVPAPLTKSNKYTEPIRMQPVKIAGEMEFRILAASAGPRACAEIIDRNNNPNTHRHIVRQLLEAKKPTSIKKLVDRNQIPYGGAKPIQHVNHLLQCGGVRYAYFSNKKGQRL